MHEIIDLLAVRLHEACKSGKLYPDPRLGQGERLLNHFVTDFMTQLFKQYNQGDINKIKEKLEIALNRLAQMGYVRQGKSGLREFPILTRQGLEYFFVHDKIS
ncbi:MAG: hypothetical protein J1E80_06470 [Desulfovibrionaceae bacterium]|nr:hypothetical protein [Desulfovibrionaceae bacterium]